MKFKEIHICNFRNFKDIKIELDNKNVIFGLNDVGKTNFLNAIRFLLDSRYRSKGFKESDFHQFNIEEKIIISLKIDISDRSTNEESQLIIQKMKGSRSEENDEIIIQLTGKYDMDDCIGIINMEWGSSENSLQFIPTDKGSTNYHIDKLFNIYYIDSFLNLEQIFKQYNRRVLSSALSKEDSSENAAINQSISNSIKELETCIEKHPFILEKQQELSDNYKKFRPNDKNISIKLKPDIAIKGYTDTLLPYIHTSENETHLYPTNGDGRKKLLSYSLIYTNLLKNSPDRINIFLLEEPENNLHFSLQSTLSKQIFKNDDVFKYLFMTTHSSKMLNYLNDAQLIKINNTLNNTIVANSIFYNLQKIFESEGIDFKSYSKQLNNRISESLFYKYVLLVEGPSEYWLFNDIYEKIDYDLESYDKYILQVDGVNFKPYIRIFNSLGIKCLIKTDNDLRKGENETTYLLGLNRALSYIDAEQIKNIEESITDLSDEDIVDLKKEIFNKYKEQISKLNQEGIYLSKVDLENDLYEACPKLLDEWKSPKSKKSPIIQLQNKKNINMIDLLSYLTKEYAEKIINSDNFLVLKKFKEL